MITIDVNKLVNEYVTGLRINEDQSILIIDTNNGMFIIEAFGDCCSETWFADIIGVKYLLESTVVKVEKLDLPDYDVDDNRCRQEEDTAYGIKIITNKGEANIIYRNSSNGYYGGYVECTFILGLVPIKDDWQA